jgi:hypothetical protein
MEKDAPIDVMERLAVILREERAFQAEQEWNQAMLRCQARMGPIRATVWNPATKSHYATFDQLDAALRPIYTAEDMALSYGTGEQSTAELLWVTCDVIHKAGHSRRYQYPIPIINTGIRGEAFQTMTHAAGSAGSYGKRYLEAMIFNIPVEHDDDGNKAGGLMAEGIAEDWLAKIQESANPAELQANYLNAVDAAMAKKDFKAGFIFAQKRDERALQLKKGSK